VDPQSHRRAGTFDGMAVRPRRRRAEEVKSESDRVRGKEMGMVFNQMEAGWLAQESRRAWNWVATKEGRAEASRSVNRRSEGGCRK
jgi:hypothetical protein